MKSYSLRLITLAAICISLVGCADTECEKFKHLLQDEESRLLGWGMQELFHSKFTYGDFSEGGFVGPGHVALRRQSTDKWIGIDFLRDAEVRLLGKDPFNPIGYFIGYSSFRGIIVAKDDLTDTLDVENISSEEVRFRSDFAAVICRERR